MRLAQEARVGVLATSLRKSVAFVVPGTAIRFWGALRRIWDSHVFVTLAFYPGVQSQEDAPTTAFTRCSNFANLSNRQQGFVMAR